MLAEALQVVGRNQQAEELLSRLLVGRPRLELLDVLSAYVAILRSSDQSSKASATIAEWRQALRGAGTQANLQLEQLDGCIRQGAASKTPRVVAGTRIALFGGREKQRERCSRVLEKLGFAMKDIAWKDGGAGMGLRFAECRPLIDGAFDCYVVVTSHIGHDTSLPAVAALKNKGAKWTPLEIHGHELFELQITAQLSAWDLVE